MTLIITGGAGYIGGHVVSSATVNGKFVSVLDDLSTGISSRLKAGVPISESTLQNLDDLNETFSASEIIGVFHLAAKKRVGESVERPDYYWQQNVVGFENLLTVMAEHGVKKLVYSSSAAVYGQPNLAPGTLIEESADCSPINPYGETKLEGERLARKYAEDHGASVVALRYFNVAGAGQPELGDVFAFNLIPILFEAIDNKRSPKVFGDDYPTVDGSCIRDYVHVQDLAEAHIAAMNYIEESGPGFTAINIGTGIGASVLEVINMVQEVTGIEITPDIVPRREGDPASLVADVTLAKELLGWESKRDLREIVASAWDAWNYTKSHS